MRGAYLASSFEIYPLDDGELWILGRANDADIVLPHPQISRRHLEIRKQGQRFFVRDLNSRYGTSLNDQPLAEEVVLKDGDRLTLADSFAVLFRDPEETGGEATSAKDRSPIRLFRRSGQVQIQADVISPPLSVAQFRLLDLLYQNRGAWLSRSEVIRALWPDESPDGVSQEAVDGLIKRLRSRLRQYGEIVSIEVARGWGLRLLVQGEVNSSRSEETS